MSWEDLARAGDGRKRFDKAAGRRAGADLTKVLTAAAYGGAVADGWDGTWSQSGLNVTVNAASWNSALAANGDSVTIGFNGSDTGQDTAPTVLSVNGTACAND